MSQFTKYILIIHLSPLSASLQLLIVFVMFRTVTVAVFLDPLQNFFCESHETFYSCLRSLSVEISDDTFLLFLGSFVVPATIDAERGGAVFLGMRCVWDSAAWQRVI